ncbi:bifunctional adenosylcobinamide kinase/adenosylcobinamide-phosphate guanylyltransferase [Effusibacillus lacus]|uniref:Adenosylcobinamide kinase n=1 Tax=Effusibacillus lacus TaxID=1348429 RepID=A0A292YJN3_9BACL|nr:bifunctional adenosylcobinamide kinase/adenosylcobinamide-phosphate guanylyltransferase [Effusibacillus lacus]TCS70837.1 adenosylcobinamide kinase /adenosylcobinamide-phosphate guanylyltransferase [Effusibacillus lacus]GAX89366.1 adenosylcobinamide kinase/adenosylcobinamide phosphate guanyltransferase [Effusibacillus lacus]
MDGSNIILVIGGSRSGKSRFAEEYCQKLQMRTGLPVTYVATCPRFDKEMEARIDAHIKRRPAEWGCIEEPIHVADRIRQLNESAGILLLDCLSLLLNNWLWEAESNGREPLPDLTVEQLTVELMEACLSYPHPVIIVTSEVGAGLVPESKPARLYRDQLGLINQVAARLASAVYAVIAGIPVNLKEIQARL